MISPEDKMLLGMGGLAIGNCYKSARGGIKDLRIFVNIKNVTLGFLSSNLGILEFSVAAHECMAENKTNNKLFEEVVLQESLVRFVLKKGLR